MTAITTSGRSARFRTRFHASRKEPNVGQAGSGIGADIYQGQRGEVVEGLGAQEQDLGGVRYVHCRGSALDWAI